MKYAMNIADLATTQLPSYTAGPGGSTDTSCVDDDDQAKAECTHSLSLGTGTCTFVNQRNRGTHQNHIDGRASNPPTHSEGPAVPPATSVLLSCESVASKARLALHYTTITYADNSLYARGWLQFRMTSSSQASKPAALRMAGSATALTCSRNPYVPMQRTVVLSEQPARKRAGSAAPAQAASTLTWQAHNNNTLHTPHCVLCPLCPLPTAQGERERGREPGGGATVPPSAPSVLSVFRRWQQKRTSSSFMLTTVRVPNLMRPSLSFPVQPKHNHNHNHKHRPSRLAQRSSRHQTTWSTTWCCTPALPLPKKLLPKRTPPPRKGRCRARGLFTRGR